MSKVLLSGKYSPVEPLGLLYLSTALKEEDIEHDLYLYDNPEELSTVKREDFEFVGFSVFTGNHKEVFNVADKLMRKDIFVILGGPHATYFAGDCSLHADAVVKGEGIRSIVDVVKKRAKGVFRYDLIDENDLPTELFRDKLYKEKRYRDNRIKNVMTAFGCPYDCSYCYDCQYKALYNNPKVRIRDARSVIVECYNLRDNYPLELIFFQDDYFGYDVKWLKDFSVDYKRHVGVPFHCQLRPEGITEERLKLLKEAGCIGITVAIECANEFVRKDLLKRKYTDARIMVACKLIKSFGLKLRTEQMLGVPDTTLEDELKLLEWNVKIRPDIAWASTFVPYRGTTLGEYCSDSGLYDGNNDDIADTFFERSVLNFDEKRKDQIAILQKMFSILSYIPKGHILARKLLESDNLDFKKLFNKTRKHLYDHILYSIEKEGEKMEH